VPGLLRDTSPGQRVLLRLDADAEEWWLCEIQANVGAPNAGATRDVAR
jgi:hypothetical protein